MIHKRTNRPGEEDLRRNRDPVDHDAERVAGEKAPVTSTAGRRVEGVALVKRGHCGGPHQHRENISVPGLRLAPRFVVVCNQSGQPGTFGVSVFFKSVVHEFGSGLEARGESVIDIDDEGKTSFRARHVNVDRLELEGDYQVYVGNYFVWPSIGQ